MNAGALKRAIASMTEFMSRIDRVQTGLDNIAAEYDALRARVVELERRLSEAQK